VLEFLHWLENGSIVVLYFVFAAQTFVAWRELKDKSKASHGLLALSAVFVFCSLAGYLSVLIPFLHWLEHLVHIILVAASVWLVWSNQAAVIMSQLNNVYLKDG